MFSQVHIHIMRGSTFSVLHASTAVELVTFRSYSVVWKAFCFLVWFPSEGTFDGFSFHFLSSKIFWLPWGVENKENYSDFFWRSTDLHEENICT